MRQNFNLPPLMRHLKQDERGYPIPFFVPIRDGKPDFKYADPHKRDLCMDKNLCFICGQPLVKGLYWFISGPIGLKNRTSSDTAMHEQCARFSLVACPHLVYEMADRRTDYVEGLGTPTVHAKPKEFYLVLADKWQKIFFEGVYYIRYRPRRTERYYYQDNRLTREKPKS